MKPLNLLLFWIISIHVSAQLSKPIHSENLALGIGNSLGINFQSGFHNPANIFLDSSKYRIGVSYSNYYFINSLNQVSLSGQVKIANGGISFSYANLGWSTIQQHYVNVGYGIQVAKGFRLGIACHYFLTQIPNEEADHQGIFPSIGFNFQHKNQFQLAFHIDNPIGINWFESKEKMPIGFDLGFRFQFSPSFSGQLELVKVLNTPFRLSLGFEYAIKNKIRPRMAFSILPLGFSSGIGVQLKQIQIGFALWYGHPLGPISHFDASYEN